MGSEKVVFSKKVEILIVEDSLTQAKRLERILEENGFHVSVEFPWPVARIVLQHHERMNGSGYPGGLSGDGILPEARIMAVADVVEAMSSHRPYRPALGIDKALEEISQNKGVLYDSEVVDACLKIFREKGFKFHP
jgi:HD-GYP domain-containing protein (c-di-GMP phosphodiesterase class II)